ncbi:MFS transporter [Luteococcus peritonei]|uniref:MFS transporter n=1 Tax=Luteococcus peritonei TaxID=88874 RepID=A0ABW4RUB2_9ACTN
MSEPNLIRVEGTERTFNRLKVLFVLLLPLAMSLMALSSVNVALPTIEQGLEASSGDVQWILSGYALSFGVALTPAGRLGDLMGRGTWFLVGLALFVLASIACALAPSPLLLNAGRIVQGLGAGLFSPQVTGMITQYFQGRGRARAFSMFGLVISASVAVGPVLTGAIIGWLGPEWGWRWAFLINLPLGVLGIVLGLAWFPFETERRRRSRPADQPSARLDLDPMGMVLLTVAILCLMYPFMAHAAWAWALLPVAPVLLWAWVRWERRYLDGGREPMVDLRLFDFHSFRNGMLVSGVMFLGVASTFAVAAVYVQSGLHVPALQAGLMGLPNAVASAFSAVWSVKYVMTAGRRLVVWMLGLMALGTALSIAVILGGLSWWWLAATLTLNGFGMGAIGSANQTLSMEDVPPRHGGTAGGIKQTVERIGAALGNAMITGILFGMVGGGLGWNLAFAGAFAGIVVCVLAAMAIAVHDEREHRIRRA